MSEKLKPCPFCGGTDIALMDLAGWEAWCRDCGGCAGCTTNGDANTRDQMIAAWNRRELESASQPGGGEAAVVGTFIEELNALTKRWYPCANEEGHLKLVGFAGAVMAARKNVHIERFFQDHGLWHDRVTGQHMYTQDQYDELRRNAFHNGYASRNEEIELAKHKDECVDMECQGCVVQTDGEDWTNGGQYEAAIQNPSYFRDERPTRRSKRYGPYDVAWMGAGVWAGLPDELPSELVGKKVWVTEVGHNHGKKLQRDGTLRAAPSAGNGGAEGSK